MWHEITYILQNSAFLPYCLVHPLETSLFLTDGLSSADPTSDWNAPAEEWGNWVEEENPPSIPQLEEVLSETQKVSD